MWPELCWVKNEWFLVGIFAFLNGQKFSSVSASSIFIDAGILLQ